MRPAVAIDRLEKLKAEAEESDRLLRMPTAIESWKARVRLVFVHALGAENNIVNRFDRVRYTPGIVTSGTAGQPGQVRLIFGQERSYFEHAHRRGVGNVLGLIDAAIYELGLAGGDEPVDEHAYDPELWALRKLSAA